MKYYKNGDLVAEFERTLPHQDGRFFPRLVGVSQVGDAVSPVYAPVFTVLRGEGSMMVELAWNEPKLTILFSSEPPFLQLFRPKSLEIWQE